MKNKHFYGKIVIAAALAICCSLLLFGAVKSSQVLPGQLELVSRLTFKALENNHLRKLPQDHRLSAQIFDEYFRELDPGKVYFTRQDIARFSADRLRLLEKLNSGELRVIFAVYKRYLQRLRQYRAFAENVISSGLTFESSETYCADRKKLPYCKDDAELKKLWMQRIKNDILYYRLMQKVMEEHSKDPSVKADMKKRWFKKSPEDKLRTRLHDMYNYASQQDSMDILGIFLTAAAQVYGPHSHYATPKQEEDFNIQFKLSLTGIGATLTSEDGYIKVVDLVPGGPADKDGRLQPEDRIIAVAQDDGEPVDIVDMSVNNAVKLIRGSAGTVVRLTILPAAKGAAALPMEISIKRAKVELKENAASGKIHEVPLANGGKKRIGVITLNNFYMDFEGAARQLPDYRSCTRDVRKILENFNQQKVDAVVLDFRNNSGGSLVEAINMSGLFITHGPIVQVVDAAKRSEVYKDRDKTINYNGPLVMLVSKFSASSAEILCGALQDYRRALIVGDSRTFGKGTVLNVTDLSRLLRFINRKIDAGSLTHEIAMFYRVNGESTQARGIRPDIVLPSFSEVMEIGEVYSDNHLPWNRIDAVPLTQENLSGFRPVDAAVKDQLLTNMRRRWQKQPHLLALQKEIERFKTIRNRREVSLNEAQRLKEYYDEKAAAEKMEEFLDSADKKKKGKKDILLEETLNIAAEYANYQQNTVGK